MQLEIFRMHLKIEGSLQVSVIALLRSQRYGAVLIGRMDFCDSNSHTGAEMKTARHATI